MEFTTTEMGQRKLIRKRYVYVHRRNLSEGSSMWDCIYWRKGYQCNAKVKLSPLDEFLNEMHKYTHAPWQTECKGTKVKAGIKRQAEDTKKTTQQILGTDFRNSCSKRKVAANLPSLETLRRNVRYSHHDRNMPPTPAQREDIPNLPQAYRTTTNRDPFLVYAFSHHRMHRSL